MSPTHPSKIARGLPARNLVAANGRSQRTACRRKRHRQRAVILNEARRFYRLVRRRQPRGCSAVPCREFRVDRLDLLLPVDRLAAGGELVVDRFAELRLQPLSELEARDRTKVCGEVKRMTIKPRSGIPSTETLA